jgi:hypothetical protein
VLEPLAPHQALYPADSQAGREWDRPHTDPFLDSLGSLDHVMLEVEVVDSKIRRPAGVSDWKVLFLFCSWLVLVPLFSCCAIYLRLNTIVYRY